MLLLLAFGIIGDMRIGEEGRESLQSWMAAPGEAVFGRLPTTAWWVYLYSSVGTVNLNAAVDTVEPVGYPHWSIIGLFPTIIRGMIYDFSVYELKYPLEMVNPVFNVFTLYGGYLADFGLIGCFAVTGFLALVSTWCYQGARSGNLFSLLIYAVMFQVMVLSIFWDNLASHPALFQIMLAFAAQYRWRLWSSTTSRTSHAHS